MNEVPSWEQLNQELDRAREAAASHGSPRSRQRHRDKGRGLARERLTYLLDPGSFREIGRLADEEGSTSAESPSTPADGVVTGTGRIDGQPVAVQADDGTVYGGARGTVAHRKVEHLKRYATEHGLPYIALLEGSAGRIQQILGAQGTLGMGAMFRSQIELRDSVATVSAVMGSCFGGPAFVAALSDYVPLVNGTSWVAMSGPPVVRAGTGQVVTPDDIGGPDMQAAQTGLVTYVAPDESVCLDSVRAFVSLTSQPVLPARDPVDREVSRLQEVVPTNHRQSYDMHDVIELLVDEGLMLEFREAYAPNLITGLARFGGRTCGIIASQPRHVAGVLDTPATRKASKFLEMLERRGLPAVFLHDVPGFLVGIEAEESAQVDAAAQMMTAVAALRAPKISVILRKSFGLAYVAMCPRSLGADQVYAWPGSRVGLMGPGAAARILAGRDPDAEQIELDTQTYDAAMDVRLAAAAAGVDDIIKPAETRRIICEGLAALGSRKDLP